VKYPLTIPMAATEGGVTPWYLLTLANGGQLFDSSFKPLFQKPGSAGYKPCSGRRRPSRRAGLARRGHAQRRHAFDKFTAGQTRMVLRDRPGNLPTANDPSQSSIAGRPSLRS